VGLNINHSGMHRHSAYILQNSDLRAGGTQMLMATLVRYHRKAIKLDDLPRFTLFRKKQFLPLIQLLRRIDALMQPASATTTPHATAADGSSPLDTVSTTGLARMRWCCWIWKNGIVLGRCAGTNLHWKKKSQTPDRSGYHQAGPSRPAF
jgi:exopolyphosphatase/pppGpp-phosphohydrolase